MPDADRPVSEQALTSIARELWGGDVPMARAWADLILAAEVDGRTIAALLDEGADLRAENETLIRLVQGLGKGTIEVWGGNRWMHLGRRGGASIAPARPLAHVDPEAAALLDRIGGDQ